MLCKTVWCAAISVYDGACPFLPSPKKNKSEPLLLTCLGLCTCCLAWDYVCRAPATLVFVWMSFPLTSIRAGSEGHKHCHKMVALVRGVILKAKGHSSSGTTQHLLGGGGEIVRETGKEGDIDVFLFHRTTL